jgi:anti-sigma28 factor (negative regulator of flagellin synthesis)
VERLRQRVQTGSYDVDPQLVAGAMIEYLRAARTR